MSMPHIPTLALHQLDFSSAVHAASSSSGATASPRLAHRSLERTNSSGSSASASSSYHEPVSSKWRTWSSFLPDATTSTAVSASTSSSAGSGKDRPSKPRSTKTQRSLASNNNAHGGIGDSDWSGDSGGIAKYVFPPSVNQWHSHGIGSASLDQNQLLACSWSNTHNYLDCIAFANTSRAKNEFRIFKISPIDPKASWNPNGPPTVKLEPISTWTITNAGRVAAWSDWTMAVPLRSGAISIYSLRKSSSSQVFLEQPKLIGTIPAPTTSTSNDTSATTSPSSAEPADGSVMLSPSPSYVSTTSTSEFLTSETQYHASTVSLALDLTRSQLSSSDGTSVEGANFQRLLATRGFGQYVWDLTRLDAGPIHSHVARVPVCSVSWLHLWPAYNNYARGSVSGSVKVYDIRVSGSNHSVVWKVPRAHFGQVRSLDWSPFVPYWFATAGEDAVAKVWDVRYSKGPVVALFDHSNAINSIAWCPAAADNLATGSSDRSLKIWNLRTGPHFVVATVGASTSATPTTPTSNTSSQPLFSSSLVSASWSNTRPYPLVIGVSSSGEVVGTRLNHDLLCNLSPDIHTQNVTAISSHTGSAELTGPSITIGAAGPNSASGGSGHGHLQNETGSPLSEGKSGTHGLGLSHSRLAMVRRRIERNIYARAFDYAFRTALSMAISLRQENKIKEAKKLLNICYARPAIEVPPSFPNPHLDKDHTNNDLVPHHDRHAIKTVGSMLDIDEFRKELEQYSYFIPPNYPDHLWPAVEPAVMLDIEVLKMNLELEQYIRKMAPNKILQSVDYIVAFLQRGIVTVDAQILHKALLLLLPHDAVAALHVGAQLAAIYANWQKEAIEAAASGASAQQTAKFHSSQAAMIAAGGSGHFAPSTSFVDPDGIGSQYFLNIVNSLLHPIVYQEDKGSSHTGPEITSKPSRRRHLNSLTASVADSISSSTSSSGIESPRRSSRNTSQFMKRPLFGLIHVPEYVSSYGFGVVGGLRLSHDLKISSQSVAKQLAFMRDFYATLWGPKPFPKLFELVEAFDREETLCLNVDLNRIYLNALLMHKMYDKFYIKASRLVEHCKVFAFGTQVTNIMISFHAKFRKFLQESRRGGKPASTEETTSNRSKRDSRNAEEDSDAGDTESDDTATSADGKAEKESAELPNDYVSLQKAVIIIVSILHNAILANLPKNLPETLPVWLKLFAADLRIVLFEYTGVAVPLPDILAGESPPVEGLSSDSSVGSTPRSPRVAELDEMAPLQARHARRAAKAAEEFIMTLRSFTPQDPRAAAAMLVSTASSNTLTAAGGISGGLGSAASGLSSAAAAVGASASARAGESNITHTQGHHEIIRALDSMLSDFVKRVKRKLVAAKQGANRATTTGITSPTSSSPSLSHSPSMNITVTSANLPGRGLVETPSKSRLSVREIPTSLPRKGKEEETEQHENSGKRSHRTSIDLSRTATESTPRKPSPGSDDTSSNSTSTASTPTTEGADSAAARRAARRAAREAREREKDQDKGK